MSSEQVQKTVRKSEMAAQNSFDYGKLVFPRNKFLKCSFQEEKEEVTFIYEIKGYKNFSNVKKENKDVILITLIDCAKMAEICQLYKLDLKPDNLFYDIHNQVYIMKRDVYGKGEEFKEEDFLKQYKSLIGFALQNKYSYEDYFKGGMKLLEKDKLLSQIGKLNTVEELKQFLTENYENVMEENRNTKVFVDKRKTKRNKILLVITSCLLVGFIGLTGFLLFYIRPYEKAVIGADKSYLELNYSGVIDSFQNVKINRLSVYDKYILANSYIQSESLTGEQKENIMSALSLDTNEKILDYWIYLGRLNVTKAEDIAQQVSDNDLLLYAYLKDKSMAEADTSMSGSDKEQYIEDLTSKIEKLSETYSSSEDEDSQETSEDGLESSNESESTDSLDTIDVVE